MDKMPSILTIDRIMKS